MKSPLLSCEGQMTMCRTSLRETPPPEGERASWRRWHIDSHLEVGTKSTCAEKDGRKRCEGDPFSGGEEPLKVYG